MSFIYAGRFEILKGIKVLFKEWKAMGSGALELIICGTDLLESWCKKFILNM